ncbi:MAG TPA: chromosome segregation protein SMC [Thermoplasmata archaeon]|nr:chromosome segregation protein SMC [Thermoplasmata archaeon]
MYLKRLKLRNFKSFSGATEIPFQAGFTGVAGPNGMGKSNISDAILFVLGPTSSKALRAERLTHLFFNGGSSKKAATECEVSLVFDNSDHLLPVEAGEVEVTRYVKLAPGNADGYYSYFYVNGKRSTQTEIDTLLSHARLSGDGYNLVQQGDVNKVVTMGPIPRRGLLERLAGISQYDEELDRAGAKRTDLDQNLDRIQTLLSEIKGRLSALEGQRLQAIQYKQLLDDKRRSEARLARAGHRLAEQEVETCRKQVATVRTELERLEAERTKLTAKRDELKASIDRLDQEIADAGGAAAVKFKQELDEKKLAHARAEQNLSNLKESLGAITAQVDELSKALAADEKQRAGLAARETALAEELKGLEKTAADEAREMQSATSGPGKSQEKLAGARKQQLELARQQESRQKAWEEGVRAREVAAASLQAAERSKAQAEEDLREREVEVKDLELRAKGSAPGKGGGPSTGDLQKELFALKTKEKSLTAETDRLSQEVLELNRRYLTLDARLKARTESGAKPNALAAVDFVLSQRNLGKIPGIRGTLEELAEIDPKVRTALQVAGGSRLQAIVVDTDQVAEACIRLLREEKRGRATFLPLSKMLPGRPHGKSMVVAKSDGAVGFAIDLVQFDEALRPAFWYVFGETIVMDDLAHARAQMGGVRLVTLSGDLIEATGAISGGYLDPNGQGRGSDSAVELKRLADELRQKSAAETAGRQELGKVADRLRLLAEELSGRSIKDQANQSNLEQIEKDLKAARERLSGARDRIARSEKDRSRAASELERAERTLETVGQALAELKTSIQQAQEQYLAQLPNAISGRLKILQEQATKTQEERLRANGELESARASIAALVAQIEGRRGEIEKARGELAAKKKEVAQTEKLVREASEALATLKSVEARQDQAVRAQADQKRGLDTEFVSVAAQLAKVQGSLETRNGMLTQEETRLAQSEARLKELDVALQQFPEPEADEKPMSVEELKRKVAAVEQQLASMGDVNQRAVEEYDAEKGRLDEFSTEVQRLATEKAELVALVAEIEKKKREKVGEVVTQVNTHFREIYGELSAGGEGEISLENPDDPLAGGLLIKARPVGKTVARLEQLSGGEKSLASLAFIFSLQRYDPSPLYVFDEVDMSLDGLNAEYVGRLLRRNAERAQFVVISLRKVTLKFAHHLYGVTMRGDGCSRVVGIQLDDIQDVESRENAQAPEAPAPVEAR